MGLYSGNGLCFVAIDGGFKLRCVGPEKFSATNSEFADNYYVYSEDPYVSEEISVPTGMSSVYAKTVADVPSGTSYKFEISTSNGFSELIPVADFSSGLAAVNSNAISLNKSSNPNAQSVYDSMSVGDSIFMNATEFRVSNKYDDGTWLNLVFVTKTGGWASLPVGTEWFPVMVSSANWTEIPSGSLNGTVAASVPGTPSGSLWYRITLSGDSTKTKTPTVSSVRLSDVAFASEPQAPSESGAGSQSTVASSEISDAVADKAEILSLLTAESNKDHEERAYKSVKYAAFLNAPNFASTVSGVSKVLYVDLSK